MDDSPPPTPPPSTSTSTSTGTSTDASERDTAAARRRAARGDDQLGTDAHPISELQATIDAARRVRALRDELSGDDPADDQRPDPAVLDREALDDTQDITARRARAMAESDVSDAPDVSDVPDAPPPVEPLAAAMDVLGRLRDRVRAQVLGRDEVIDLVLVALLADGHVLLEDFPGSGKTTLAKSLGQSIVDTGTDPGTEKDTETPIVPFRRIQFTPDLLPSDVTGVTVFDAASHAFHFRHGPIFAHVVLADEINRTSPKVQAAMLEAMAEKQVTVDNVTHPLDRLFFVIATQNPLDLAGTYPLPVAQLDRFLFKIRMEHIDRASELEVLETWRARRDIERADLPKVTRDEVLAARAAIDDGVTLDPRIQTALVDLAQAVRTDERVIQGCSTRSLVLMLPALQAQAALRGRDYVSSDDLETLVPRVLGHRLELAPGVADADAVIDDALATVLETLARSTLNRPPGG